MNERIEQLQPGQALDSFFAIAEMREGTTRSGNTFLTLTVQDKTGRVTGRIWDPGETCPDGLTVPGVYRVIGKIESYRDELQLNIDSMAPYRPTHEEYDSLVLSSRWSPETLTREIREHVNTHVRSATLKRLLMAVLEHPDVAARLGTSAAAKANHHAYRGGLAEHTLSGMRLGTTIAHHYATYYPGLVDADLLIAGFMLHDLGKVWELEGDLATEYSTFGRLVGHIPAGAAFIASIAKELGDVPDELVWELQHIILSHHGELEFGSPKRPKTLEAQLLHYVDQIDAKTNTFFGLLAQPGWTNYQRMFGRPLLEPSEMRSTWTTPPDGHVDMERGPGARPLDETPNPPSPPKKPARRRAAAVGSASPAEAMASIEEMPSATEVVAAASIAPANAAVADKPLKPAPAATAPLTEPAAVAVAKEEPSPTASPAPSPTASPAPSPTASPAPSPTASPAPGPAPALQTSKPAKAEKPKSELSSERCEMTLSLFDGLE
ncbi:MAG: 3'-5' exoribonuclease [Bradymonadia bacterium]|jgi:3'-5' exoribonuclease